jgi:uncharacterized protein (TIGR00296 family)
MDPENGLIAVREARRIIDSWVRRGVKIKPDFPEFFNENIGVFVTIDTFPDNNLRGCIGFVEPRFPLSRCLVDAAIAATRDPRFLRLETKELDHVLVEVSILTTPQEIKVRSHEELPGKIEIGKDGLMVRKGFHSGLLLPQIGVENCMDTESFLIQVCTKAGLGQDEWKDPNATIYKFQADVFAEKVPYGKVEKKELLE